MYIYIYYDNIDIEKGLISTSISESPSPRIPRSSKAPPIAKVPSDRRGPPLCRSLAASWAMPLRSAGPPKDPTGSWWVASAPNCTESGHSWCLQTSSRSHFGGNQWKSSCFQNTFYVERIEELSQEPDAFIDYAVIATQQQIASIHVGKGPARRTLQVFRILDPKTYYLDLHPAFDGAFLDAVHHLLSA